MPQTLTVAHTPIGGSAAGALEVATAVREAARAALADAALTDSSVLVADGGLTVVALHEAGEGDTDVHRVVWNALDAAMSGARAIGAPGLGAGLTVDAFSGSLRGTGLSLAELVMTERPAGPLVVLVGEGASVGVFNLPLARLFADPFATPGLVHAPGLRRGFNFEVHDLDEPRKRMFAAPAELHELLGTLAEADRYLLQRVVTAEGGVVAVASSAHRADVLGSAAREDAPIAIVRTGGDAPALEDLVGVLGTPQIAWHGDGNLRPATHRAFALHIAGSRLLEATDLTAGEEFQGARRTARNVTGLLAAQGPFAPRRGGVDEGGSGGDPKRWSER